MLQNLWLPGEVRSLGERVSLGVWDERVHSVIFKWIANKDLLYSTQNSAQCYVAAWMGW